MQHCVDRRGMSISRRRRIARMVWMVAACLMMSRTAAGAQRSLASLRVTLRAATGDSTGNAPWSASRWPGATSRGDRRLTIPQPFAAFSAGALLMRDSLVSLARAQVGRRYRLGGTSPAGGFDCSGLVRYVTAALHINLPRTADEQAGIGVRIAADTGKLRPGDLLTFGRGTRVSHIGIYVGNGRMVHASSKAGRVVETNIDKGRVSLVKPWKGVRRVLPEDAGGPK